VKWEVGYMISAFSKLIAWENFKQMPLLGYKEYLHRQFLSCLQKIQHSVVVVLLGCGEETNYLA